MAIHHYYYYHSQAVPCSICIWWFFAITFREATRQIWSQFCILGGPPMLQPQRYWAQAQPTSAARTPTPTLTAFSPLTPPHSTWPLPASRPSSSGEAPTRPCLSTSGRPPWRAWLTTRTSIAGEASRPRELAEVRGCLTSWRRRGNRIWRKCL